MAELTEDGEPRVRPGGVTAIAVVVIIFGALGFCIHLGGVGQMFISSDPGTVALKNDSLLYYHSIFGNSLGWCLSIAMVFLGVGLWGLKEWARKGMVLYSIFYVLWLAVSGAFTAIYIIPKTLEIVMASQPQKLPANVQTGMYYGMMASAVAIPCVMILIYMFFAFYLTRPKVKEAFQGTE